MAESSRFFDSSGGDRTYTAGEFADYFAGWVRQDGVAQGKLGELVPTNDNTLFATMASGMAYKGGYFYKNTATLQLPFAAVTTGQKRIDRLVIRVDTLTARSAVAAIIQGVATSGTPSAPALGSGDLAIAQYLIDNTTGSYVYTVTDERVYLQISSATPSLFTGQIFEMGIEVATSTTFPAIPLWENDVVVSSANYPLLIPLLRAQKYKSWSGSAYVSDHTVTVSGSNLTGSGTAWNNLCSALAEDATVHGSYTSYRPINVAGTDYAVSAVNTGTNVISVTGSPPTGSQTAILYGHRIAGSSSTARIYKDSGRATYSADGSTYIGGLRRRFRTQGHVHETAVDGDSTLFGKGPSRAGVNQAGSPITIGPDLTNVPYTDGTNGTPIIGPSTDAANSVVYRYLYAGSYVA